MLICMVDFSHISVSKMATSMSSIRNFCSFRILLLTLVAFHKVSFKICLWLSIFEFFNYLYGGFDSI